MSNKELVEAAKQAMQYLCKPSIALKEKQAAYNCLRLFCERIEQTNCLKETITSIQSKATKNLLDGQGENDAHWGYQEGVLLTNKQALDIAKFVPLYQD
jgi:hypothetical protein